MTHHEQFVDFRDVGYFEKTNYEGAGKDKISKTKRQARGSWKYCLSCLVLVFSIGMLRSGYLYLDDNN